MISDENTSLPDGGWRSWLVVLAAFILNILLGVLISVGVLLPGITAELDVGRGPAGEVQAIMLLVCWEIYIFSCA